MSTLNPIPMGGFINDPAQCNVESRVKDVLKYFIMHHKVNHAKGWVHDSWLLPQILVNIGKSVSKQRSLYCSVYVTSVC